MKYHLKRVMGNTLLTFEEFLTILCQVEACLNSRPLYPISDNPNDPNPLTPAHFLIGEPLTTTPQRDLLGTSERVLSKYLHLQQIVQHFWSRWMKEYISQLQIRAKWKTNCTSLLKPGLLVLVKEDGLPSLKWRIGRITRLFPGSDGIVRNVILKTASGSYQRPVSKLSVIPNQ